MQVSEPLRNRIAVLRDLVDSEEDRQKQNDAHHEGEEQWRKPLTMSESRSEARIERPGGDGNDDSPADWRQKISGKPEGKKNQYDD